MTIQDLVDKMTEEELQSFYEKNNEHEDLVDSYGGREIESPYMEKKEVNGYDVYDNDGFVVIVKNNKLITILRENEGWRSKYFDGVIIFLGHDSMTMFSTRTEEVSGFFIR